MSEKDELKPCPFCGGPAAPVNSSMGTSVFCTNDECFVQPETGAFARKADAIAKWNTRIEPEAADRGVSEARGAVATALYDTFHTARLSEHPEDAEAYGRYADTFAHWLNTNGFAIQSLRSERALPPVTNGERK